jgi:hypothetical protein
MRKLLVALPLSFAVFGGCSKHSPHVLFTPKPECMGAAVVPFQGQFPQIISQLAVGSPTDGFDLDGDGKPDNKLAAISSLAMGAISDALTKTYSIIIPIEFFNLAGAQQTSCVKFAVYLGTYAQDSDGDTVKSAVHKGDCNDHDPNIKPGAPEIVNPQNISDLQDHDCDGKANQNPDGSPCTNALCQVDNDHDGFTVAQGDCDDTNPLIHPGMPEICGDGFDNDCDGQADRTEDANGNVIACSPFDPANPVDIVLDPRSFDATGAPAVAFNNGSISKTLKLDAGPSKFGVNIPVTSGLVLDLALTGAQIDGDIAMMGNSVVITNGRIGGVIDARTMDTIRGLSVSQIGLTPDASLLDATFANLLGPLLALPKANATIQKKYPGCRTPDIDVDGDGLEAFCDSLADSPDDMKKVDVCIDGDGTEIHSTFDANGVVVISCAQAVDSHGTPRFVDGVSVELNFATTPLKSIKPPA